MYSCSALSNPYEAPIHLRISSIGSRRTASRLTMPIWSSNWFMVCVHWAPEQDKKTKQNLDLITIRLKYYHWKVWWCLILLSSHNLNWYAKCSHRGEIQSLSTFYNSASVCHKINILLTGPVMLHYGKSQINHEPMHNNVPMDQHSFPCNITHEYLKLSILYKSYLQLKFKGSYESTYKKSYKTYST